MKFRSKLFVCLALALLCAPAAFAQSVTTGTISGEVRAQEDGSLLPGVTVNAVHEPTGTRYTTVTQANGRFQILNVRVGGPYKVSASLSGFKTEEDKDLFVSLGQTLELEFQLQLETITETLTVVSESTTLINSSRTGATSNVSTQEIERLPTISRGLEDFARTNPFFSINPDNDEDSRLTVAGRNNRYNNISIDGAVNNDLFGLAGSGTPGGQTQTTPISLDAIQEIQLLVAPFDVRQGGFSGGGINAITRNGTNRFAGSAYYFTRDDSLTGDGGDALGELGTFDEEQYGFRLGGPISRDKIFFFVSGEVSEKTQPTGFSIGGGSGQNFGHEAEARRFRDILLNRYGYDPGGLGEQSLPTDSDKVFARLDFNLGTSHNLTVRHNFVDANIGINRPDLDDYEFPGHTHTIASETNSTVFQLNSVISPNLFNEARVTYQTVKDRRTGDNPFPWVQVRLPDGDTLIAGTERFSTANALDQDILEITNDLTWIRGDHTFTFGTHNELFGFDNLFIRENFGSYQFASLDDLEAGLATQFDHSFSQTSDPQQSAQFDVEQFGFYVGDQWAVRDNITLTLGLRVDIPQFPDVPSRNPQAEQVFGRRTDVMPDGNEVWSPRFGFNWDIGGQGTQQLRGGLGIFAGRTPYVWVSNQFSNTGIEFGRLRARSRDVGPIPFNPDPFGQPTSIGGLFTNEIDVIDPDFEFPQVMRYSLAYDRELGWWGLVGSVEVIYADTLKDILYQNLNYIPTGQTAFDGRPIFTVKDRNFSDVIFLTNTDKGEQTTGAIKIERPFRDGLYGSVSYTYGESKVVNDGTSSQAVSNWRFIEIPGDPNNPPAETSDFDVEHRFNAALSYQFNRSTRWPTTVSMFYNHQSGRPYSTTFAFDFTSSINGDNQDNDLLFVPENRDQVIITGGTWEQLDAYIEADAGLASHRGGIVPRNASRAPWSHSLDLRLAQEIPIRNTKIEVTLDLLNLANLFDSNSGLVRFADFSELSPVRFDGIDPATGKPIYNLQGLVTDPANNPKFQLDNIRSRWQAKLGVRWTF